MEAASDAPAEPHASLGVVTVATNVRVTVGADAEGGVVQAETPGIHRPASAAQIPTRRLHVQEGIAGAIGDPAQSILGLVVDHAVAVRSYLRIAIPNQNVPPVTGGGQIVGSANNRGTWLATGATSLANARIVRAIGAGNPNGDC